MALIKREESFATFLSRMMENPLDDDLVDAFAEAEQVVQESEGFEWDAPKTN